MDALGLAIREKVFDYVEDRMDLRAFHAWFAPEVWNIDQRGSDETRRLGHRIDLLLAEFQHGDWTEDDLKRQFKQIAKYNVSMLPAMEVVFSAAGDALDAPLDFRFELPASEFVDIRFEEASVS